MQPPGGAPVSARAERGYRFGRDGLHERRRLRIVERLGRTPAQERTREIERRDRWRLESRKDCPKLHRWRFSTRERNGSPECPRCRFTRAELELFD